MDALALLLVVTGVVALNTVVLVAMTGLTIRSGRGVAATLEANRAASASATGATGSRSRGPGADPPSLPTDPLAASIDAFLARGEGIFREGGPAPSPDPAWAADPRPPAPPGPAGHAAGAGKPPTVSPPVRFVAAGPLLPGPGSVPPDGPLPAYRGAGQAVPREPGSTDPGSPSESPAAGELELASGGCRSTSVVSVAVVPRASAGPGSRDRTVDRLGSVVGSVLRERTRAGDSVVAEGPARFLVVLPGTPTPGGAALAARLRAACDAWLAAEALPLRLELTVAEAHGAFAARKAPGTAAAAPIGRPDRRRSTPADP